MMYRFTFLFLFIVLSSSMFAQKQERIMQSIEINDKIFEEPTLEKISFDEFK